MDTSQAEFEITVIKKIMEDSRRAVYNTSLQGVFWGTLMAITIIINYLMLMFSGWLKYSGFLWMGSVAVGVIGSIFISQKEKRNVKVKTFAGKILATLGFSVGGACIIYAFAAVVAGAYNPVYIVALDSIVLGLSFFVIGMIQQLKILKIISLFWWAGGIFFMAVPSGHCLLFLALMLIISVWLPKFEENKQRIPAI